MQIIYLEKKKEKEETIKRRELIYSSFFMLSIVIPSSPSTESTSACAFLTLEGFYMRNHKIHCPTQITRIQNHQDEEKKSIIT